MMKRQARLTQKNEQAQERQEVYDALNVEEKMALLDSRPGESKKERKKLQTLIDG
jgi:hypothetical protein